MFPGLYNSTGVFIVCAVVGNFSIGMLVSASGVVDPNSEQKVCTRLEKLVFQRGAIDEMRT